MIPRGKMRDRLAGKTPSQSYLGTVACHVHMETKAHDVHSNAAPRNSKMQETTPENSVPLGTLKLRKRHEALRSATLDDVNRLGENVMSSSLDKLNNCTDKIFGFDRNSDCRRLQNWLGGMPLIFIY